MNEAKQIFVERGIQVFFEVEWMVIKLDEHRYYRRVSGHGISGVDFMAVHPIFGLALIEMKNYVNGSSSIAEDLDLKMLAKREDSIRLIQIINAYYERQFYFRLLRFIGWKYLYPKEWLIWLDAKRHLDTGNFFFLGVVDH